MVSVLTHVARSFALSSLLFSSACRSVETTTLPDRDPTWVLAHHEVSGPDTLDEYVRRGETIDAWTHLMSVQTTQPARATALEIADALVRELTSRDADATFDVVGAADGDLLIEWHTNGTKEIEAQGELTRIVVGPEAAHRVSYSYKGARLPSAERVLWIARLREVRVLRDDEASDALRARRDR